MGKKSAKHKAENNGNGPYDPMAVTWSEKYSDNFKQLWEYVPNNLRSVLVTLAVFIVGISINGKSETLNILLNNCVILNQI